MHGHTEQRAARRGLGLIMAAAALWGTVGVTTQTIYNHTTTTPLSVGFFRLALATPVLALLCWLSLGRRAWQIARRDLALMAVIGAMLALYQVCFLTAITYCGVAIATLVTLCTAPVLVALLSAIFLGEHLARPVIAALGAALLGTALLVAAPSAGLPRGAGAPLIGAAFALGSGLGYAVVTLCGRRLAGRAHPLQSNTVAFGVGALVLLACSAGGSLTTNYSAGSWLLLVYLGVVPSALGYSLFLAGMRVTSATVASTATLLEPLTATVLAWWLLGERLTTTGLVGGAVLLGALALLVRHERQGAATPALDADPARQTLTP